MVILEHAVREIPETSADLVSYLVLTARAKKRRVYPTRQSLAWIIHEDSSQKRKDALKG